MKFQALAYKSSRYYTRYYKLVAIAIIIAIMVITGSMLTGNSVRTTLVNRVSERLGNTETIIFPGQGFMAEQFAKISDFGSSARGILFSKGFISVYGRLIPVSVWGVNDMDIPEGGAKINPSLQNEIGANMSDGLALRLPANGLIPQGSLFVTESYSTGIRLSFEGIVSKEDGGNISLKNEQIIPYNIFINRSELADLMDVKGKINLILSDKIVTNDDLNQNWNYSTSGLHINHNKEFTEITSDQIFIPKDVVENICQNNSSVNRMFSYLGNAIRTEKKSIPYSFVTAADKYENQLLKRDEVILSDYSAKRLQVKTGDSIWISFFTSSEIKNLQEDSLRLMVSKIVPISQLQTDTSLSANFPGLSNVDRCTDWDSDLPIDMDLITKEDEDYWDEYKSTPKAIISYEAITDKWSNAYGDATAIRVNDVNPDLSELTAGQFGIQIIHPKVAGLNAAKNGVDFSGLFLSLGFFIIISALLLLVIPFSEMIYQRSKEMELLKSIGYSRKRIIRMMWRESAPVIIIASLAGVVAGFLYTAIVMWLLGSVWKGATHTEGFAVHINLPTILTGLISGLILSFGLIHWIIVRSLKEKKQKKANSSSSKLKIAAIASSIVSVGLIAVNILFIQSVPVFMITGIVFIASFSLWGLFLIASKGKADQNGIRQQNLKWKNIRANKKQSILAFFSLSIGVYIVFSVGLNRQDFSDHSKLINGTGGYTLWAESTVPVYYDMNSQQGRSKLNLNDLPANTSILQCLRYEADEASCLNLNKVSTPTVLGLDINQLNNSEFKIQNSLNDWNRRQVLAQMQTKQNEAYPALVDATVLQWSLVKSIGDTLRYHGVDGKEILIQIIGTLSNSVFQGNILMDKNLFTEIWPEKKGIEIFLVQTDEKDIQPTKQLLQQALNNYGVLVTTTNDRLRQFNTVTDTYLSIFLTLGGLGLLLGIFAFIIVIRKNLATREAEIKMYFMLGFPSNRIRSLLYNENLLVPIYALLSGIIASLIGVSPNLMNIGMAVWSTALILTLFFIFCVVFYVKKVVFKEVDTVEKQHYQFDDYN
nr:ABC transporter permease [uncultured Carboxylicivirga sp.]